MFLEVYMNYNHHNALMPLAQPFGILNDIKLRNVTRLNLGPYIDYETSKLSWWHLILSFLNTNHLNRSHFST